MFCFKISKKILPACLFFNLEELLCIFIFFLLQKELANRLEESWEKIELVEARNMVNQADIGRLETENSDKDKKIKSL